MIISKHTLARKSAYSVKSVLVCYNNGIIYFSKSAAIKINAPAKISFDFDKGICFYDDDDGFEIKYNQNGFFICSYKLIRHINALYPQKRVKFNLNSTIDKNIFKLDLL
jgi:hypothetical protein